MQISDLIYLDSTGFNFPDYPTILSFVQSVYQGIYGSDVYLEDDSKDGQWVAAQAQMIYDTASVAASVINSFAPGAAQGTGLSRLVKMNGLSRLVASNSTVDLVCGGTVGTTVTNGIAMDSLNQQWLLPTFTIPSGGTITVTATAQNVGAVAAQANTVTQIFTPTQGWQTVNNPNAATQGNPIETDAQLRMRQEVSTSLPALTVLNAMVGSLANIIGVTNVRGYENDTNSTDGNGIPAYSVCMVINGGDVNTIASTIALYKTPGVPTYGNTTISTFDPEGMPMNISFETATQVTINCTVTISSNSGYSTGFASLIQAAVAAIISNFDIGNDVLITQLYAPAYLNGSANGQTYDVVSITLGKNGGSQSSANVAIAFNELPICSASNITVVVT